MHPFSAAGSTVNVSASTTTGNVALGAVCRTVRVYNAGSVAAFINFGTSSAVTAATTTSVPIPAGAVEVFAINRDTTHMAAITASSTATVYATPGDGL